MRIGRMPSCPRCEGECGFWGSGMRNPTLYCTVCGWNEEDGNTSAERYKEHLENLSLKQTNIDPLEPDKKAHRMLAPSKEYK